MKSQNKILSYLKESFEKELSALKEETEARKKEIMEAYKKKAAALKASFDEKERLMLEELKKEYDYLHIFRINQKRLMLQRKVRELIDKNLREVLKSLRDQSYERVFHNLVKETPHLNWKYVKVNPEDRELALSFFPEAIIVEEEHISGGFELVSEDKRVFLSNSFEKRAERIKDDVEQEIFSDILDVLEDKDD